ncbi:cyclin N-terminal domain-containing protein 1 [Paramormyrops kingsleyae]|uniref:cyclin N-terminal domain-containing protein 1 n=1 Tax=Paramormyrops kingsleyae TaxID=1676925 RepID=UPI003B973F1C
MDTKHVVTHSLNQAIPPKSLLDDYFSLQFGQTPFDILLDSLNDLNNKNRENLKNVSEECGSFKESSIVECVFLICEELKLDPFVGYQAVEILERFMVKHVQDMFHGLGCVRGTAENAVFYKLKDKINVLVFTCVQLASKMAQHLCVIDSSTAVNFLHSMGFSCSKKTLLEFELLILGTLEFCINVPNPLTYVETLLEALNYNATMLSIPNLYTLCKRVLQFVYLQRSPIYHSLLVATTGCPSPCQEQRVKFVSVKEDYMLLGVGVIATGAFILNFAIWTEVVEELCHITGISARSIMDFTHIILRHIVNNETPQKSKCAPGASR